MEEIGMGVVFRELIYSWFRHNIVAWLTVFFTFKPAEIIWLNNIEVWIFLFKENVLIFKLLYLGEKKVFITILQLYLRQLHFSFYTS